MKRKMIGAAAAYMSGLFFASFFNKGSDLLLAAGLLALFFIIAAAIKFSMKDSAVIAVFFIAAYAAGTLYTNFVYDKIISYNGAAGSFTGTVKEVSYYDNEKAGYTLDGKINGECSAKITFFGDAVNAECGDSVILEDCTFSIPDTDYLFDGKSYYKSEGIFLTVENAETFTVRHNNSHRIQRWLNNYREKIISDFKLKAGTDEGGFLAGIVFGEKSGVDDNDKTLMYRCGIGHILAVSGLHVSMAAAILMIFLKRIRCGKYLSFILMNIFLVIMIIMVKSPVSAIRAAIMLDFMYSARLFRRQNDTFNSLAGAVLLLCILNPYVIKSEGFLLSVSGTFGIGVFAPYMTSGMRCDTILHRLIKNTAAMFCASLAVMPLSILYFDETSIISALSNVFIVPLTSGVMIIGMVYAMTGGMISLLSVSKIITEIIFAVTDYLGRLRFTHFSCGNKKIFFISLVCTIFIAVSAVVLRNRKYTAISVAGAIAVFAISTSVLGAAEKENFKIAVLGKNTSAAVVISYKGRTDIIDLSGNYKSPQYVAKYLSANGTECVQTLFLTEREPSQYAAYINELELTDISQMLSSSDVYSDTADEDGIVYFHNGYAGFKNDYYSVMYENGLLKITYGGRTVAFQSTDAEKNLEADLSVYYGNIKKSTVVREGLKSIYLDDTEDVTVLSSGENNFEIILESQDDVIEIRRL